MTDEQKYNYCLQLIRTVDGIRNVNDIIKAMEDYLKKMEGAPRYEELAYEFLKSLIDGIKLAAKSFNK